MRLSIIVPAYNVAAYIEKCIRSLEDQDIPEEDYEIIVTNDGSTDYCQEIVERLQMEFTNIILINQENQGVSMARNNAISIARGKYIMPIDPDDYVAKNCFKSVIEQAERDDLDVLYCPFEILDENGKSIWRTDYSHLITRIDNGYEGYFAVRGPKVIAPDRSWAILYSQNLLRTFSIEYPKDVPILEDGLFLGKVFSTAERVGYSNKDFYFFTVREGSAMNSKVIKSKKALKGFLISLDNIITFKSNIYINRENSKLINFILSQYILLYLFNLIDIKSFQNYKKSLIELKIRKLDKIDLQGVTLAHKNYLYIFNLSPTLFYYVRRYIFHINNIIGL